MKGIQFVAFTTSSSVSLVFQLPLDSTHCSFKSMCAVEKENRPVGIGLNAWPVVLLTPHRNSFKLDIAVWVLRNAPASLQRGNRKDQGSVSFLHFLS